VAGHIFQARPVWIYTQSNITNIIFTRVHNINTEIATEFDRNQAILFQAVHITNVHGFRPLKRRKESLLFVSFIFYICLYATCLSTSYVLTHGTSMRMSQIFANIWLFTHINVQSEQLSVFTYSLNKL
jgi:hypothetical protein